MIIQYTKQGLYTKHVDSVYPERAVYVLSMLIQYTKQGLYTKDVDSVYPERVVY